MPGVITPDVQFSELYAAYRPRIEGWIANRLPRPDSQLAEDLAAETFISVWRSYTTAGRTIGDKPFGLLAAIASRRISDHYRLCRNQRETAVDTGHWSFANSNLTPAASGAYEPVRTGFRTATIGGAR
jgi:DNA-directed RNA polymerase specialized sigma24 family protein